MKRNLARIALLVSVLAWLVCILSILMMPVNAEVTSEENGRIPGDDTRH